MYETMELRGELHVINGDNLIYKLTGFNQIDSTAIGFSYNLELVAGYEYIDADNSNVQGYVSKEAFTDEVQWDMITFYPLIETLAEALADSDYTPVNINSYKIHQFKGC